MKQKIPFTKLQKSLLISGLVILGFMFIRLIMLWPSMPNQIPYHYNAAGEVDDWASKGSVLFVAFMGLFLYGLLLLVNLFPSSWNMPVKIDEGNSETMYRRMRTMLCTITVVLAFVFMYLTLQMAGAKPLAGWFLPIVLVVAMGLPAYTIVSMVVHNKKNNKRIG